MATADQFETWLNAVRDNAKSVDDNVAGTLNVTLAESGTATSTRTFKVFKHAGHQTLINAISRGDSCVGMHLPDRVPDLVLHVAEGADFVTVVGRLRK